MDRGPEGYGMLLPQGLGTLQALLRSRAVAWATA